MASHVQLFKHFIKSALKNFTGNDSNKGSLNSHVFSRPKNALTIQVPSAALLLNEFNRKEWRPLFYYFVFLAIGVQHPELRAIFFFSIIGARALRFHAQSAVDFLINEICILVYNSQNSKLWHSHLAPWTVLARSFEKTYTHIRVAVGLRNNTVPFNVNAFYG